MTNKRVYYLSGIDARGAAIYYRLFREQARKSAALSGATINTGKLQKVSDIVSSWQFDYQHRDIDAQVDYRFLHWEDVAKKLWIDSPLRLICIAIPHYIAHYGYGIFGKFRKAGKGPFIASISPVIYCAIALMLAILLSLVSAWLLSAWLETPILLLAVVVSLFLICIKSAIMLGDRIGIWWVLQTIMFMARYGQKPIPALDDRIEQFADTIIAEHLAEPEQEVLLLGHCIGTMVSVSVLSKLIQKAPPSLIGKLSMVTLGQCIPYLSYIPTAKHFHQDLQRVVDDDGFPWVDYGAIIDPFCFAEVSPGEADAVKQGLANRPMRRLVKLYKMFSAEQYQQLKKDKHRLHMQYLMAADIETEYNFFAMIAQPNDSLIQTEVND